MKITLQQPFLTARGRDSPIAGNVLYPVDGRMFSRKFVQPGNPNSLAQQAVRNNLTAASQAYSDISGSENDAWAALSAALPRVDKDGLNYDIGAKAMYVAVNSLRLLDGQAVENAAPPAITQLAPSDITSVEFTAGAPDVVDVTFPHANDDGFFLLELTRPLPGVRRQPRDSDLVIPTADLSAGIVAQAASPQVVSMDLPDMRFALAIGDRIGVRITAVSPGYIKGQSIDRVITIADGA